MFRTRKNVLYSRRGVATIRNFLWPGRNTAGDMLAQSTLFLGCGPDTVRDLSAQSTLFLLFGRGYVYACWGLSRAPFNNSGGCPPPPLKRPSADTTGRRFWGGPLTRKRHTMPHSAQSQHTNYWAPRTRKRHQQEHRPQRPTESSDPTQHAKGRTGDRPGPRKGATTRRNVTQGGDPPPLQRAPGMSPIWLGICRHKPYSFWGVAGIALGISVNQDSGSQFSNLYCCMGSVQDCYNSFLQHSFSRFLLARRKWPCHYSSEWIPPFDMHRRSR